MALKEVFARFSFAFDGQQKLNQAGAGVDRLAKKTKDADTSLATLAAGFGSVFAGNALLQGLNTFASELDVLDDLSTQTKITTDDLQVLGFAAEKSGSSAAEMNASLTLLQKSLGKTTEATGAQVEALSALGIDTSKPQELAQVLPEIFAGFGKLKTGAEKASVATSLFGRAGVRLIPTLERGQEGLADLRKELEESGGLVDNDTIAKAGEYRDNIARLDRSFFALKGTVAGALFPQLSKLFAGISKGVGTVSSFVKGTTLADNAAIALAGSIAGPLFGALRPFLLKGLKFAAIYGAIDDLIGFVEGKDSLVADLLDGMFGHGTADGVRDWVNDAIDQFQYFVGNVDGAYATMESSQATWVQKSLAGVALLTNGSVSTFAAISEGWESILLDMTIAIDEFVLGVGRKWDAMVDSMGLPKVVTDFLKGEGEGKSVLVNEEGLAQRKARQDELSRRAYERETGTGQFAGTRMGEEARGRSFANIMPGFNGLREGEAGPVRETRRERVNRERAEAQAAAIGLAPKQVTATLQDAAKAGTTVQFTDAKTVNLTFGSNTTASDKEAIKKAVAEALRTDNRAALEALTQRAKK